MQSIDDSSGTDHSVAEVDKSNKFVADIDRAGNAVQRVSRIEFQLGCNAIFLSVHEVFAAFSVSCDPPFQ